jgi:hypothetical protein
MSVLPVSYIAAALYRIWYADLLVVYLVLICVPCTDLVCCLKMALCGPKYVAHKDRMYIYL